VRKCKRKKLAREEEEGDEGNIVEGDWGTAEEEK
jgi:hypothetical protein